MANINAITKRKQIMLASSVALIVVAGGAVGGICPPWISATPPRRPKANQPQT
ncbi:hypothetical protein PI860_22265 (plasmid) [Aeromonas salmonicida subsp. salmonicida]|nr:hypothetical protein [Aeromonas salmonicida]WCB52525.1 hypothetical protein PI860_22265 [Aeromonas salmonicida subsp. salmonicida]